MKRRSSYLIMIMFMGFVTKGQTVQIPPVDKSPMDMSYYPAGYPILKIQDKLTEPLVARILYSRPQKNGRNIFGELVEYGKVWRLGANEASEIEFYRDVRMGGTKVKKGRYTLYAIPLQDQWTIILNKETDTWGSFKYDVKKDVARITVKPETNTEPVENLSMYFDKDRNGFRLQVNWDNLKCSIPFYL